MEHVVVVGAGVAGLTAAAFLARADVPVVVLDRRDGPSDLPRSQMVSARSMELLRELGLADQVLSTGRPGPLDFRIVATLRDAPRVVPTAVDDTAAVSPVGSALCDQDLLETLLRERAAELGVRFDWGRRVRHLAVDADGVGLHGPDPDLRSHYVVLAEGAGGALRAALQVRTTGADALPEVTDVLFRSPELDELMTTRPGSAFICRDAATMVFRRDLGRWQIGRRSGGIDDVAKTVAAAAGRAVRIEVLGTHTWRPAAAVADRFRVGGVFLVGDVAHTMPPSLGLGGNTAISDAHNLAWKLALTLRGDADPVLLDSYESERRPFAQMLVSQSLAALRGEATLDRATLQLGVGYPVAPSSALLGEDEQLPVEDPHARRPRVGVRLPHRWLPDGRSTLDLTRGQQFVAVGHGPSSASRHHLSAGRRSPR